MMIRLLLILLTMLAAAPAGAADEPLEAEQAYVFSARAIDAHTLEARWQIADGYYLYRQKIRFTAEPAAVKLGDAVFPAGHVKNDEFFGQVETYRGDLRIRIPVDAGSERSITLKAVSQGCWDKGICFPPTHQQATVMLVGAGGAPAAAADSAPGGDESSRIAGLLKQGISWVVMAGFFGIGLGLSLNPCTYPMVPILSSIIVSHGHAANHRRALALSLAYVLGLAITYALAGIAAAASGVALSNALQNAWILSGFALIFVALSFSMFGFYELQLPSALQSRLSERANRLTGGLPALFTMGALSALIAGPCMTAPLTAVLLYIAKTGDVTLGGSALFVMGFGMGTPLVLVGVFSRTILPRPGPWMEAVKQSFGVVMLATALWLVSPVIPVWAQMLGWAALLIVPGIFMRAIDPLPEHANGWNRLWKGVGVLMLLGGTAMLAGVLGGARDPLRPLGFLAAGGAAKNPGMAFARVKSAVELDARLQQAAAKGQTAMLDFYADWCVSCKELEKYTFTDAQVQTRLADTLLLQADVTASNDDDLALLKRFELFGPPGIIFFGRDGKEIAGARVVGYQPANEFLATLDRLPH
jgi:thiol:disulfide interchange protein DsbD